MLTPLSDLLGGIAVLERHGPADTAIAGLAYDSRAVMPGFLFFALPGLHADGQRFIPQALQAGARAIVYASPLSAYEPGIVYLRVADPRTAMSPIAAAFHGSPSRDLTVIGVTGTEGKSTTVFLIYQLLCLAGFKAGFFSTVMSNSGAGEVPNPEHQTTPEATAVHRLLAEMRAAGMEYAVVESSSHGLSPRTSRLADVAFDVALMMNVTHEHLEFHGSWEQYREDKANLFRALDRQSHDKLRCGKRVPVPSFGLVSADDPSAGYFREATKSPVYSFGSKGADADFRALEIRGDAAGASFLIESGELRREARIELPGTFNVDNALAALVAVSKATDLPWTSLLPLLPKLRPVRGRMTTVEKGQPFELLVDYAHTPSSFRAIFPPLRERAKGRLIALFGSGGERDRDKRPQQGRIAADHCEIVILSDEDPRGEEPMELLEEIAAGCPEKKRGEELFLIPDRPSAIRKAFSLARPGDIVLLLGKGHENSIIYAKGSIPYDEIGEAEKALAEMGFGPKPGADPRPEL